MNCDTTPNLSAESFEERLRAATASALETLVTLASNLAEPGHARLAAAEILRFAARHKPEPPPTPPRDRDRAPAARPLASSLGAMLNLLGGLPQPGPAQNAEAESSDTVAEPAPPPDPAGRHCSPRHSRGGAAQQGERPGAAGPPASCSDPEESRRSPEVMSPHPRLDPRARMSARKRKRAKQRAARARAVPRPT